MVPQSRDVLDCGSAFGRIVFLRAKLHS